MRHRHSRHLPRFLPLLVLVVFAVSVRPVSAQAPCVGKTAPTGAQTIDVGGARRSFVVRSPSEAGPDTPAPVVFAFHPFGMSAQYMQARVPLGRLWPQAIGVFADGLARDTGGGPSWQGRPGELGDRDVAFFDAMVAWLDERACVDRSRIFVLGYSNGAALAYVLTCVRPAVVAGAAIAAGRLGCQPTVTKPVIMSHGVADRTIGYENAVEASKVWAGLNRCAGPPPAGVMGCSQAQACGAAPVSLCTHGGGHEYDPTFTKNAIEFLRSAPR